MNFAGSVGNMWMLLYLHVNQLFEAKGVICIYGQGRVIIYFLILLFLQTMFFLAWALATCYYQHECGSGWLWDGRSVWHTEGCSVWKEDGAVKGGRTVDWPIVQWRDCVGGDVFEAAYHRELVTMNWWAVSVCTFWKLLSEKWDGVKCANGCAILRFWIRFILCEGHCMFVFNGRTRVVAHQGAQWWHQVLTT